MKFNREFMDNNDPLLIECCKGIENFYEGLNNQRIDSAEMSSSMLVPPILEGEHPYRVLGNLHNFVHSTYIEKFYELLGSFIASINSASYVTSALCGRSIIESVSTLRYYNKIIFKKGRNESPDKFTGIDLKYMKETWDISIQHIKGSNFDWQEFYSSDRKKFIENLVEKEKRRLRKEPPKKENYIKSLNIGKFLDSWFDDDPELVSLAYNFFSELVHPNMGSNLLLNGISGEKIIVGSKSNRAAGKSISREAVKFLSPCLRECSIQLAHSYMLSCLGQKLKDSET